MDITITKIKVLYYIMKKEKKRKKKAENIKN